MFRKKEMISEQPRFQTRISSAVTVDGTFLSDEDVLFSGKMKGNVKVNGVLEITSGAEIIGDIEAHHIIVSGTVEGNCRTTESLEICDKGTLKGDVYVGDKFIISPGAVFLGSSKMLEKADIELEQEGSLEDDLDLDLDDL